MHVATPSGPILLELHNPEQQLGTTIEMIPGRTMRTLA